MNNATLDFLGNSWKFPIEFKKTLGTVEMLSGEGVIKNSLDALFATRAGERLMHSRFGSSLSSFLFMPLNKSTLTYMEAVIRDEILFNEPRVIVDNIEIVPSVSNPELLEIKIEYKITATNNRYNYVYPFYFSEATNLER